MTPAVSSDPAEVIVDRQAHALIITWQDEHRSVFPFDDLRRDCPCASCEDTRNKRQKGGGLLVLSGQVLKHGDAQVVEYHPVGWYALNFRWNDGHDTGIYTYQSLRAACPCEHCSQQRKAG